MNHAFNDFCFSSSFSKYSFLHSSMIFFTSAAGNFSFLPNVYNPLVSCSMSVLYCSQ